MYQMGGLPVRACRALESPSLNFCNKYHVARVIPMGISVWPRGVQYGAYRHSGTYSAEPPYTGVLPPKGRYFWHCTPLVWPRLCGYTRNVVHCVRTALRQRGLKRSTPAPGCLPVCISSLHPGLSFTLPCSSFPFPLSFADTARIVVHINPGAIATTTRPRRISNHTF